MTERALGADVTTWTGNVAESGIVGRRTVDTALTAFVGAIVTFVLGKPVIALILAGCVVVVLLAVAAMAMAAGSVEDAVSLLPGFRQENPQTIKQTYQRRVDALAVDYPLDGIRRGAAATKATSGRANQLRSYAAKVNKRADMHWGRSSARSQFRAAWAYVLAGMAYERAAAIKHVAELPAGVGPSPTLLDEINVGAGTAADRLAATVEDRDASDNFHFAGNVFRNAGAYEQAMRYYYRASYCHPAHDWQLRGLERALGAARLAGKLTYEATLAAEITALTAARTRA